MGAERSIGWLVKLALKRAVQNAAVIYLGQWVNLLVFQLWCIFAFVVVKSTGQ